MLGHERPWAQGQVPYGAGQRMEIESGEQPHLPQFADPVAQPVNESKCLKRLMLVTPKPHCGGSAGVTFAALARIVGVDAPFPERMNDRGDTGFEIVSLEGRERMPGKLFHPSNIHCGGESLE